MCLCVCVCVCACVCGCVCLKVVGELVLTHCTITCFGFRALRIESGSVVYFYSQISWSDQVTWDDVYLYLCTEKSEVRVIMCNCIVV